jgi:16S rRNA (guanine1207-N2)-methyltransferase
MATLPNTHEVLLRNADLLEGQVALLGVTDPALLPLCPAPGIAMSEHAGVFARLADQAGWQACFGYQCAGLESGCCDTVIVFMPKVRAELELRLAMARYLGREGARLVLIGGKKEGIAGAAKPFQLATEGAGKVDSARHCQVWAGSNHQPLDHFDRMEWVQWQSLTCAGIEWPVAGMPGIFSQAELDAGTRLLLENLAEQPLKGDRVLDFACGAGVIGSWLQAFRKTRGETPGVVDGIDVQAQAVTCARATYERNQVQGEIMPSDGLAGIEGRWQAVVSNPPFHSGVKTDTSMTEQFLAQVAQHLDAGGELRLVANSFLPYEALIQRYVGPVEKLAQDRRFTVYRAFRKAGRAR